MAVIWVVLAVLFLLDAFRIRGRVGAIVSLPASSDPVSPEHRFLVGRGVALDEATKRAASAHARAEGLTVLDLLPGDLPTQRALGLLQVLDPGKYRRDRLGKGLTAGHVMLVTEAVLDRAEIDKAVLTTPPDAVGFARIAGKLKRYAKGGASVAIADGLRSIPEERGRRLAAMREVVGGGGVNAVLIGVPVVLILLALGAAMGGPGWAPLLVFQLQPLVVLAGTRLRSRDLIVSTLFRAPLELWNWITLLQEPAGGADLARVQALRPVYAKLLEKGTDPFFEPRRTTCPLCDAEDLSVLVKTRDLVQHKPGRFFLDRCGACGHVFQNPRLSIEGLNFYYRDFYDGLGEDDLDMIFGASDETYGIRAGLVKGEMEPSRWLDVGGGHGHFSTAARDVWPKTQFDGLDLSESIEEATRRGWVDKGYRGLFPDLAPEMKGHYDVVSMSHYLEHTRDPKAEIDAARLALRDGGLVLIEIPDPECSLAPVLGRYWLPWFQPQHQHFVSYPNLRKLLEERGFSVVKVVRGEAHIRVDFSAAVFMFLSNLAPPPELPWCPPGSAVKRFLRMSTFVLGMPLIILGLILDNTIGRLIEQGEVSNAFRVLARKGDADEGTGETTETEETHGEEPAAAPSAA